MPSIANLTSKLLFNTLQQQRLQTTLTRAATTTVELSNFLSTDNDNTLDSTRSRSSSTQDAARLSYVVQKKDAIDDIDADADSPLFTAPRVASLVASSAEDLSGGGGGSGSGSFRDITFDIFDDEHDLYGSPLAFDASEHGLWNGRFVPPPPRPPFFVDEPVLSDGLTTCDLCSWAMPTKSTFIFEGTIEKATELGWPLTLIIVSVLSALLGAIIMIAVVRCRRKKSSQHRNDTHVQWWSRNKRPNGSLGDGSGSIGGVTGGIIGSNTNGHNGSGNSGVINNNHLRRSNIYTAHPADSIRGMHQQQHIQQHMQLQHQQQPTLSAASSLSAMTTTMIATAPPAATTTTTTQQQQQQQQTPQYFQPYQHLHTHHQQQQQQSLPHTHQHSHAHQHQHQHHHHHYDYDAEEDEEHEYHQPQELQLQLPLRQQHQREHSCSMTSSSLSSATSISAPSPTLLHASPRTKLQHNVVVLVGNSNSSSNSLELQQDATATTTTAAAAVTATRHWPQATSMVVAS